MTKSITLSIVFAVTVTHSIMASTIPPQLGDMPTRTLHAITGNMLGDGCLRRTGRKKDGKPTGNARFEMNKGVVAYDQAFDTYNNYYAPYSGVGFRTNSYFSNSLGIQVVQFHIFTKSIPLFTCLHSLWYTWDPILMKYIKVVPANISLMFSPLSLAHWIMDDGYFTDKTVILCTDNFTRSECERLQLLLGEYDIKSGIITQKGKFRIRIYRTSMPTLIELVRPHMHKAFLYKLGL